MVRREGENVYPAGFDRRGGTVGYVIVRRGANGLRRVDAPSDWLESEAGATDSPNSLRSLGTSISQLWNWALDKGIDPVRITGLEFTRFIVALQSVPKGLRLSSNVEAMAGDPRRRSTQTVKLRVTQIKMFYRWASTNGYVSPFTAQAVAAVKTPKASPPRSAPRLQPTQVPQFLAQDLRPRDRFAVELLYGTGLRAGEAAGLHVEDLCLDAGVAQILGCHIYDRMGPHVHVEWRMNGKYGLAKSRAPRCVPLSPRVISAYRDYQAWAFDHLPEILDYSLVFLATTGATKGQPLTLSGFNSMFADHVAVGDFAWVTPHLLRHTFASELSDAGVASFTIQMLLGHRSPESTAVYTHPHQLSMARAARDLAEYRRSSMGIPA